ncbi:MAG: radical SAM family heme chaperone HemW [Ignavibacteria bacterium]|nr:radical SAM family heme chaperone HemW [Ignavibacteria bacterium]MDP3831194.1 radical SAM family heme chaperone HemW [Ignavibacteriaceae bacterium]
MINKSALYIHIPFCDHKCIYCDFYSIITSDNVNNYLSSLKKEIDFYSQIYSTTHSFNTIYFGGGTPSLMEPEYLGEIISYLKNKFKIETNSEVTMETNPGTVTKENFISFNKVGVNRISIGIQSFNEDELKFLTRIHSSQTAIDTVHNAKDAGYKNISIDLIFNLPGQTREKWLHNLNTVFTLPIKHISAYSLILERGTILNKMVLDGKVELEDDDHDADLYEMTIDYISNKGMKQYEVSNFCYAGFESVHNNAYWHYKDYLSFGTSAHSFMNGKRWSNLSSLKMYIDAIKKNENAVISIEEISKVEMEEEYVLLALRSRGLLLDEFRKKFGNDWFVRNEKLIDQLVQEKLLVKNNQIIFLTPKGFAVCDEILSRLI